MCDIIYLERPIQAKIFEHSQAGFTHGICQECKTDVYPDLQMEK